MSRRFRGEAGQSDGVFTAIAVVVVVLALFGVFAGFTAFKKTPADKIALSYGGGPFEGNQFQRIVQPGSGLTFNGFFDHWYEYPVTQRNYIISKAANEGDRKEADAISASTHDKQLVDYELAVYFKLNTSLIRDFHQKLGLKYQAWTDGGWNHLLNDTFRQVIENSLQIESRKFTSDEIASNGDVLTAIQNGVANVLKDQVTRNLGAAYFCGPTYTGVADAKGHVACPDFEIVLKKPTLSKGLTDQYEAQQQSVINIQTNKNQALAKQASAEGDRLAQQALNNLYADPNYIAYIKAQAEAACAKNPQCTIIVNGSSGGVNVNTGK